MLLFRKAWKSAWTGLELVILQNAKSNMSKFLLYFLSLEFCFKMLSSNFRQKGVGQNRPQQCCSSDPRLLKSSTTATLVAPVAVRVQRYIPLLHRTEVSNLGKTSHQAAATFPAL